MSDVSARLALPYIAPSQAQKHVTHNEALQRLDALTQLYIEASDAVSPPAVPIEGGVYALGASPTGEWAGQAGQLAYWTGAGWLFIAPREGWRAWDKDGSVLRVYRQGGWQMIDVNLQNLEGVGIGASFDATNRLAVSADATLLSHDGAGHQLKLNKAASVDTASLLYQSAFTGHAEMGLAGDTNFSVKVSGDGATWHDALVAEAATGRIRFPSGAVPAPERAYVSTTVAQVVPDGVNSYLQYETPTYDTAGFYNPAQPERLTVPEDGGYELSTYAQVAGGFAVGDGYIIIERFNAAGTKTGSYPASWITGYTALSSPMVDCVTGDYFSLMVRQNSGADKALLVNDDRNYLSIKRVF